MASGPSTATSTLWRYVATDSSSCASLRLTAGLLRPPSMIGIDINAPSAHERAVHNKLGEVDRLQNLRANVDTKAENQIWHSVAGEFKRTST